MASGVPVLASRAGGNSEVVGEDLSEWLFAPGDIGQLTARLERLARNPEMRTRLADIGRKRVLADFSLNGMMQRYRELYLRAAVECGVLKPDLSGQEKARH
jgi:glycosyltransferase involved in cell wall biosynthesis